MNCPAGGLGSAKLEETKSFEVIGKPKVVGVTDLA
jgi:hypothetical protein